MLLLLKQLFASLSKNRKIKGVFLVLCMALSSITELLTVALIIPFISIILGNETFQNSKLFLFIENYLDNYSLIIFLICIFLFSGSIRLFTLIWQNKFSARASNEIVFKAYDVILHEDYSTHLTQSRSQLLSIIHTYGDRLLTDVINPVLRLIESIIFLSLLSICLFLYNGKIFLITLLILVFIYKFLFLKANKKLKISSIKQVRLNEKLLERLDIELNSLEFINLGNFQRIFSRNYARYDKEYKINFANYLIAAQLPRILIEYIIIVVLLLVMMSLYVSNNISNALPLLASGAFLIQKSYPYVNKIFENWASLSQFKNSALLILNYAIRFDKNLEPSIKDFKPIDFNEIKFEKVNFSYTDKIETLKNINFSIKKGEKIAIMGPSGTGKTTLIRLICGLLVPMNGKVYVNGKEINKKNNFSHTYKWMKSIGYVHQKINLTGKTLRENIVFNSRSNNNLKIEDVIRISLLEDLVNRCNGLDCEILQSSFSLSGGESQRLAIARAIYQNPKLLIMDEPTSSLDINTQREIFDNLKRLRGMTCIVITHRLETKYFFDRIFEINDNQLIENNNK